MENFAAFIKKSQFIEGDERSRTNPGHGYPAYTMEYTDVKKFKDREEMEKFVEDMDKTNNHNYELVMCTPMTVKKTVKIEIV